MGTTLGKWVFGSSKELKVLMNGLDAAGKTTILYKLKLGEVVVTIPTIGFNVENLSYKNFQITAWDLGGRSPTRALFRFYYDNTDAMIWVVDANDRDRLEIAKDELHRALNEIKLKGIPFLIFANKNDLPNAMSINELALALNIDAVRFHEIYIQPCCATTGDGLYEGLDWLLCAAKRHQGTKVMQPRIQKNSKPLIPVSIGETVQATSTQKSNPSIATLIQFAANQVLGFVSK